MKVLLPSRLEPPPDPVAGAKYVLYDPGLPIPPEHHDCEALVVWGMPKPRLVEAKNNLKSLKWIQSLGAGVDGLISAGFADEVIITSGRGLHNGPVAEHTLALVLAAARRLHEMRDAQAASEWASHLGGVQPVRPKDDFRTLSGAKVLVWGFGGIAQTLTPLLGALGADVTGIARNAGIRGNTRVVTVDALNDVLPAADLLIMILPATESTRHALNAQRLSLMQRHSWLVNVGRGSTVDEAALIDALQRRELAGAALDVFDIEPLPSTSPLWKMRNVIISPHAAGGRPVGAAQLIEENVARFIAGRPLLNCE